MVHAAEMCRSTRKILSGNSERTRRSRRRSAHRCNRRQAVV